VRTLYEDEHLLAVDKPAGLVVHPAYRHPEGTLYDLVARQQRAAGAQHLWLLHRLDRDTSGVVLLAKTELARRSVVAQFERHQVSKWYLALVAGQVRPTQGTIQQPLRRDPLDRRRVIVDAAGRPAITEYRVLAEGEQGSLLLVQPRTGRTHQIRAHLAWLGHPLIGDGTYAPMAQEGAPELPGVGRQMLHAWCVRLRHPDGGAQIEIRAPVPADLRARLSTQWLASAEAALSTSAP
jgi:23S rRNA pseudouridine1911/1915/1917 synthase